MKIGYDAKRFFKNFTGLGNYSRFIIDACSNYFPDHDYYLFSPAKRNHPDIDFIIDRSNVHTVVPGVLTKRFRLSSVWRSWGLSRLPTVRSLDIFHGLSHELPKGLPTSVSKVVTVHDLIFFRYPEFYNPVDVLIYKAKVRSACEMADIIIAISKQTEQDIIEFLKIDKAKIRVVYQGTHPQFNRRATQEERSRVKVKYNLPEDFILNVGTIERRKNIKVVIEAMAMMPTEKRVPLVIIGRPTTYSSEVLESVSTHQLQEWVHIKPDVAFSDFPAIYQCAKLFIYPSLFEGFGIPIVEAIHSGIPVITSTGSCFEEAGGPASRYVDPKDRDHVRVALEELLHNDTLRKSIVEQSEKHVHQFSQQEVSRHLMDIYREIV